MPSNATAAERADGVGEALEPQARSVRIAHLSDLHLKPESSDQSWKVWESLHRYLVEDLKPQMVLITGDVADSPSRDVYRLIGIAIQKLDDELSGVLQPPYDQPVVRICAGNHDRHWRGNALLGRARTHFDAEPALHDRVPGMKNSHFRVLTEQGNRWPVRVIAVDTSQHAQRSAQAFLPPKERADIRELWTADEGEPPRLVIMLFHHHLLPLPASEPDEQGWGSLMNLTGAVNPGKILEDLAASQVDLVLHGHEHHVNRARYASYVPETGQVAMIAAGSATGMKTLEGCDIKRASFNVLELRPDRSVWCQEYNGPKSNTETWGTVGDAIELLDPTTLRQNMFHRAIRRQRNAELARRRVAGHAAPSSAAATTPTAEPTSDYAKHFILTRYRDAQVSETRTNWRIEGGRFSVKAENETGLPSSAQVTSDLRLPPETGEPRLIGFRKVVGPSRAWSFELQLPTDRTVVAPRIDTSYLWQDAVLLTQADFELIDATNAGVHRCNGQEFVAATIDRPLRNLTLSVSFPNGMLPDKSTVKVYTHRSGYQDAEPEIEPSITERLHVAGQTIILNLPYPLRGFRYVIAWTPAEGPQPSELALAAWANRAGDDIGKNLATACLAAFDNTPWRDCVTVAAYVPIMNPEPSNRVLKRVGLAGHQAGEDSPPASIDLRKAPSPYLGAWWNEPVTMLAEPSDGEEQRLNVGMLGKEQLAAYVPIREPDQWGPPIAVLRVGLSPRPDSSEELLTPRNIANFEKVLAQARVRAISSALERA